jgi:uncharacterized protein (DUF779 family)
LRVTGTAAAERIVERAKRDRRGALVFTIGTGCCESTAPFLYEDFWPGPDSEAVGEVAGVQVFAPEYLRALYPGAEGVTVDVEESMAESMSIETEYGCRFVLRAPDGTPVANQDIQDCDVPEAVSALRPRGRQELPETLRRARMR